MLTHLTRFRLRNILGVVSILLLSTGCTQILPLLPLVQPSEVGLNMRVTASETPGVYTIAGKANLPDQTQITVAAVRYLYPSNPDKLALNNSPTYSILAYQAAEINHGEWQTNLNLWQVDSAGQYRETWQLEQPKLELSLKPTDDVVFLATLAPIDKLPKLEQKLSSQGKRLPRGAVRSTDEGQRYAQTEQMLAIALPTGNTIPPPVRPEETNYGWGERYIIPHEPQNPYNLEFPKSRQSNAPIRPDQLLK